jgi:HEAT repeat protein
VSDLVSLRLLIIVNLVLAACCLVMIVVTAGAKISRSRRTRAQAGPRARVRPFVLTIGAGEDDDGSAATALAELGADERDAAETMVGGLLTKVRGEPALALVAVLDRYGAIDRAAAGLRSRSAVRRARSVRLLGLSRDPRRADLILPMLRDRDPEVRALAVEALGKIGNADASAAILETLRPSHGRPGVPAATVAESLMALGPDVAGVLAPALADDDAALRDVAAKVARHGLFGQLAPALRGLVDSDPSPVVRSSAAEALGRIGGHADVATLVAATGSDRPPPLRRAAAAALGELGQRDGIPALIALLADPDRRLAEVAAWALLELGRPGAEALEAARDRAGTASRAAGFVLDVERLRSLAGSR